MVDFDVKKNVDITGWKGIHWTTYFLQGISSKHLRHYYINHRSSDD